MTALDDVRRASRDLSDLRREVAAHERALDLSTRAARAAGHSTEEIAAARVSGA